MKKCPFLVMIFLSLMVLAPSLRGADVLEISTADLKSRLDAGEKLLLVNSLSEIEFILVHIPGSVNIPVGEMQTTKKLPEDKQTLLVFY